MRKRPAATDTKLAYDFAPYDDFYKRPEHKPVSHAVRRRVAFRKFLRWLKSNLKFLGGR